MSAVVLNAEATDVLAAEATDVLGAEATDVLGAEASDVLGAEATVGVDAMGRKPFLARRTKLPFNSSQSWSNILSPSFFRRRASWRRTKTGMPR